MQRKTQHNFSQLPVADFFNAESGEFEIEGTSLEQLVAISGSTPIFVYSRSSIKRRISYLQKILPKRLGIHYALKANPMSAIVQYLARNLDGLDVASHGELLLALSTEIKRDKISFAGPGKTDFELRAAIAANIIINVESESELLRIGEICNLNRSPARVMLRVNPNFELKNSGLKMVGGSKPFGIDSEKIASIAKLFNNLNVEYCGLQYYFGSQFLSTDDIIAAQNYCLDDCLEQSEYIGVLPEKLNLGGGFGIPYFPGDSQLDLTPIADNLSRRLEIIDRELDHPDVFLELGRFLVGEGGIYITKIIDKKKSRGRVYLVVDGGLHQHLAATGNFGQVIKRHYPVISTKKHNVADLEEVTVVGPLCTPLDVLADRILLPILEPGDYVAVLQSGAYGPSASPSNFLSHNAPTELFV